MPRISSGVLKVFVAYSRWYVGRHFHTLRILEGKVPPEVRGPLVVYLNHAAWWDPLVCLLVADQFFQKRQSFAPIDAAMFARYGFFKHLGFFPVEPASAAGARTFLRTASHILEEPDHAVWLTPQGRFLDVRQRPIDLQPGLGALAGHVDGVTFLPMAVEYPFWAEPRAEILVAFGEPIVSSTAEESDWATRFAAALAATQDDLAARSCERKSADWITLNRGKTEVSRTYDFWRRWKARLRGEKFSPEHRADFAP